MKKLATESEVYAKAVKLNSQFSNIQTIDSKSSPEIVEICLKIRSRAENHPSLKNSKIQVKQFCDQLINFRLKQIAKNLPDEGYSMGSDIYVKVLKFTAHDDRTQSYANSCKYRPTHGRVDLRLTPAEFRHISVIGGLVTFVAPQKNKVQKCYWYKGEGQKQNFGLVKVEGFIYAGYHAKTKEAAKLGGEANIQREKEQAAKVANFQKALRLQYSYFDSLKAGNCEAGTKAFILRCGLVEAKKYRGSFLMNIAKEKSTSSVTFIERMINSKVRR